MQDRFLTLDDGLRLITVPMEGSSTVTVLVLVGTGSSYETAPDSGMSHFLEHMCFKGTKRRPQAIDISTELDAVGAQYNAFTSHEYTGYYAKVDRRHARLALDIVSDIYLNSSFPAAEIEKEKGVIIEEINMYRDMPQYHVHDAYLSLLYGDQPAGRPIAGSRETVSSFSRERLLLYRAAHYRAGSTVVVVAGNIDEGEIRAAARQAFSEIPRGPQGEKQATSIVRQGPAIRIEERDSDQVHVVMGVRTFGVYDPRTAPLRVLASILGGGMSSRLFEKLRNELGICYYVSADTDGYTDHGSLDVSAGVDIARFPQAVEAIAEEFRTLSDVEVGERELSKAKDHLIGSMSISLETSSAIAQFYGGREILRKERKTPADIAAEIGGVTARDVRELAREIFDDSRLNLAAVGRVGDASAVQSALRIR